MKYLTSKFQVVLGTLWLLVICLPNTLLLLFGTPVRVMAFTILSISTYLLFFILVAAFWKYPELSDNELIIRNALYVSYKKRFAYNDIRKVEICHGGFHYPCLRIYSNTFQHPILYGIECMSQDSILGFSADLSEKGVEVIRLLD